MALTTNTQDNSASVVNVATGYVVSDSGTAAATVFTLGFTPRVITFVNLTDRITYEWYAGMASGSALKTVAAGTRTLDASSDLVVTLSDRTFTVAAAAIPASKAFAWRAEG
jgi:hypothetical protein